MRPVTSGWTPARCAVLAGGVITATCWVPDNQGPDRAGLADPDVDLVGGGYGRLEAPRSGAEWR